MIPLASKGMTISRSSVNEAPSEPKEIPKNELPTWVGKVKENWRLNLSPDKPGKKEVGKPFNLQINVEDAKDGKMALDYNNEVNLSSSGADFVFSVDGGQSWTSPISFIKATVPSITVNIVVPSSSTRRLSSVPFTEATLVGV